MKYRLFLFMLLPWCALAQNTVDLPKDFLSKEFHRERRDKFRDKLPARSVAVLFSSPVRNRANDVDYVFHQNPDFFYLTGYREPNAVLLIFKENQSVQGNSYNEIIFVQARDAFQEMWNGRRLGNAGTRNLLGITQAFNGGEFKKYNIDFSKFDQVLFFDFENDVRNDPADTADLYDLIEQFKVKANYPSARNELTISREVKKNNLNTEGLHKILNELRSIKTSEELDLIRKAVKISCAGQVEVMKAMKPGMSEREVQGIHEYVFKKYQAEDSGYPAIVGGGHNGCILHYVENYKPSIANKELVLMDLGAEYRGYTADITRTIPANGKFSPEQKIIYDLVLKAQEEAMKICKPGVTTIELTQVTKNVINKGLKELGIIEIETSEHQYYPHSCCHHIGLDVHDRDPEGKLAPNMVITIEPGIYIPENAECDKRWHGIAVRIEDDFLITAAGCELLSSSAPRKTEDIEATMKLPSPLDDFVLPDLEKN